MNFTQQLHYMVQYFHPEKRYGFLRGGNDSSAHAALLGIRETLYHELRNKFFNNAQQVAERLSNQTDFYNKIANIQVRKNGKIVVVGDSLTDDLQSWFEIMKRSFAIVRPEDNIEFVNLAVSGSTTSDLLSSIVTATSIQADLYFSLIGVNDARIHGGDENKTANSIGETAANIKSLYSYTRGKTTAPWIWIAPPNIIEERTSIHELFKPIQASWRNKDVNAIADLVASTPEYTIDLRSKFIANNSPDYYDQDGLHWSIHGQELCFITVIDFLDQHPAFNCGTSSRP